MKYIKLKILFFATVVLMFSCNAERNVTKNRDYDESYIQYLSSVINDTTFFEIPELKIIDSSIYPVLDSVILWSENCGYFDPRIKSLYSFIFQAKPENDKILYFLDAHLSPASAIGLDLVKAGILQQIENIGIFYYRHFLFVIPLGNYRGRREFEYFPFVIQSGIKLKIRAPKFVKEKVFASYITFSKLNAGYHILKNKICGNQILIQ